jgi:hypothetical protein
MLSQFEDFPPDLEDLSLVAFNIKVSWKADKATSCSVNSRILKVSHFEVSLYWNERFQLLNFRVVKKYWEVRNSRHLTMR